MPHLQTERQKRIFITQYLLSSQSLLPIWTMGKNIFYANKKDCKKHLLFEQPLRTHKIILSYTT